MPTLPDYPGVSRIQRESPALPYGWPKLPDKRKFGSVAHEKLKFKLHIFQNYKIIWLLMLVSRLLASFCCVMRVVGCKQEEESSPLFLLYKRESDWMSFKSLTDWSTFFPRNYSGRGGGGWEVQIKKRDFRGGGCIGEFGRGRGGGADPKKNLQIWDLSRFASLRSFPLFSWP